MDIHRLGSTTPSCGTSPPASPPGEGTGNGRPGWRWLWESIVEMKFWANQAHRSPAQAKETNGLAVVIDRAEPKALGCLAAKPWGVVPIATILALVAFIPPFVASVWSTFTVDHLIDDPGSPSFPIWNDLPSVILLTAAVAGLTLVVVQWRLMRHVFEVMTASGTIRPKPTSSLAANGTTTDERIAEANKYFRWLGGPLVRSVLVFLAIVGSYLLYQRVHSETAFYDFLAPAELDAAADCTGPDCAEGSGSVLEQPAWSREALHGWWANGPFGATIWVALLAAGLFAAAIQMLCGVRYMALCQSLAAHDFSFGIDYRNRDGHFGRAPVRTILLVVYSGAVVYAVIVIDLLVIARGSLSTSWILGIVSALLLLNAIYLMVPLAILRHDGERNRRDRVAELVQELDGPTPLSPVEQTVVHSEIDRVNAVPIAIFRGRAVAVGMAAYLLPVVTLLAPMIDIVPR